VLYVQPLECQRGDLVLGIAHAFGFLLQDIGGGSHKPAPVDLIKVLFARAREEPGIIDPEITEGGGNLFHYLLLKMLPIPKRNSAFGEKAHQNPIQIIAATAKRAGQCINIFSVVDPLA
jgi:hypothetical protein